MARKRSSPVEDLVDVVAMLPWWAGVILALVSYVLLHLHAVSPLSATAQPGQMGQLVGQHLTRSLALVGQYLLPFLCLFAAVISAVRRAKRKGLIDGVAQSTSASALEGMSWREFELLVGEAFRRKGFSVVEQGGGGPDGGVDLALRRDGETFLVQCKQWKAFKVGVTIVRELYGVMAARGAVGGYVVTSGQFSPEARDFAAGRNIELIDGPALRALIGSVTARPVADPAVGVRGNSAVAANRRAEPTLESATCPKCGSEMVRRVAKSGANAGNAFWGCSRFPDCRGIRNA